jgi:hypothetical protein
VTCRKTHRKCVVVTELIGKGGGKLKGKGTKATGGDYIVFVWGNIQQVVVELLCEWVETLDSKTGRIFQ